MKISVRMISTGLLLTLRKDRKDLIFLWIWGDISGCTCQHLQYSVDVIRKRMLSLSFLSIYHVGGYFEFRRWSAISWNALRRKSIERIHIMVAVVNVHGRLAIHGYGSPV